jgi:hypothetical protein
MSAQGRLAALEQWSQCDGGSQAVWSLTRADAAFLFAEFRRYREALEAIEALRLNENVTMDEANAEARREMRNIAHAALSPAVLP